MGVKFCPKCKSENVSMVRGDNLWWRCVNCKYEAVMFPEITKLKTKLKKTIKKQEIK